ncbi:hypothetical protein [Roseomonas marmotae]|uniref:Uncharacterized protein n=1 Tax=Roseomonas marmotae TaxID=2768161 RepID=A0ABS3KD11_9PROT|nr:hypothetical protein [Roseomonas marmotae]MBO1074241.1 hypothetical protein [Roseomonas marmotae]QTI79004.1 hypothetical protein IAI58_15410 [Roseomonas marmotae]
MDKTKQPEEAERDADDTASGTVEHPIPPGEPQPGDINELAGTLGGPIDVFPGRPRKPLQQQD